MVVSVNIPRANPKLAANEIIKAFTELGWEKCMAGYLLQGTGHNTRSKIRTLGFKWSRLESPAHPKGIKSTKLI